MQALLVEYMHMTFATVAAEVRRHFSSRLNLRDLV